jgi:hypothetical protein
MAERDYAAMRAVYDEFGLDVEAVPPQCQSQVNRMVLEIIKLRGKLTRPKTK